MQLKVYIGVILVLSLMLTIEASSFGYNKIDNNDVKVTTSITTFSGNLTNISQMQDVEMTGVLNGQALVYDSSTGQWKPVTISGITDTNETVRFNVLVGTDCTGTDKMVGVASNGAVVCATDTALNTSYYLLTNPYGYYNTSNFNINNYLNKTYTLGNITGANTSLYNWIVAQNYATDAVTLSTILGFSYYNATTFSINDYLTKALYNTNYSTNHLAYLNTTNNSYYLISNPYGYLNTTVNTSYVTWAMVVNGTVSGGGITWANILNGTMFTTALFNTNYTANDLAYRNTTNQSYTTWAQVTNGTVSGVSLATLLGFSYYNATNPSPWNATNNSYYLMSNPYGYLNTTINTSYVTWAMVTNGTIGGSEVDPLWTGNKSAYANYSNVSNIFYLKSNPYNYLNVTINTSYYLGTNPFGFYNSTTIGALANTNNYWNSTFATFNKTYADTLYYGISNPYAFYNISSGLGNWSNDKNNYSNYSNNTQTFRTLTNNTFTGQTNITGNLNMTNMNITQVNYTTFCNGANCWRMYVNSSDWFIIEGI